nr:enoyl-CoA hydratase/isomerase family protein [Mesorhizobium sp. WSM4875]
MEKTDRTHLVLARPDRGNALSAEMVEDLTNAIDQALERDIRLIVIEGLGKHFCTGFDLSSLEAESDASLLLRFVNVEKLLQKIHACPVVTVAIAKGRCFGAGADLFASCDHRIAVAGSTFSFPGAQFGIVLGSGRLSDRVGRDRARQFILTSATISDRDAFEHSLATALVEEEEIDAMLHVISKKLSRFTSTTMQAIHSATNLADYDGDLAALVRSASVPGLKDRIIAYRGKVLTTSRERKP